MIKNIVVAIVFGLTAFTISIDGGNIEAKQATSVMQLEDFLSEDKESSIIELIQWVEDTINLEDYSLENQEMIRSIVEENIKAIEEATNKEKITWSMERAKRNILKVLTLEEEANLLNATFYERYIQNTTIGRIVKIVGTNYSSLLKGLLVTLQLAFITVFFGTIVGTLLALMRLSKKKLFKRISTGYIELIRGIPLLLQLVTIYLLFFHLLGQFGAVAMALIINSSAYVAEIIRSGIQAVDIGQTEAAKSLGLSYPATMRKVIMPQAIKNILPALANEFVTVIKETSLAATFYIGDLMTVKNNITSITYLALEPFIIVGAMYFLCTYGLSLAIRRLEKRLMIHD